MQTIPMHSPEPVSMLERFQMIEDVPVEISAELDRRTISFEDLIELRPGSLLTLSRATGENVDVYAGGVLIGSGEILVIDAVVSIRIAELRDKPPSMTIDEAPLAKPEDAGLVSASDGKGA
jgi:flagellar motor switch protein FliN/FliY